MRVLLDENIPRQLEHLGVGTRDLTRIEVVGTPIAKARYRFPTLRQLTRA